MSDQSPDLSTLLAECEKKFQKMTRPLALHVVVQLDGNVRLDDAIEDAPFARMAQGRSEQEANAQGVAFLVNAYPYLRDALKGGLDPRNRCHGQWPCEASTESASLERQLNDARDKITRLRSLVARVVVVMDGSWDVLPPHEQDRLAAELRDAALTDAPATAGDDGMTKLELAFLERVYAAEIDAALSGKPLRALVQSKSKIARKLADEGLIRDEAIHLGGRFPVTVRGYVLTELGRLMYCLTCADDPTDRPQETTE